MKNPFKFSSVMPIATWLAQSKEFARDIASRNDVPSKVPGYDDDGNPRLDKDGKAIMVPIQRDLRDIKGRWWGTASGRSISSVFLVEDLLQGSQSAITPVLMGLITVLTVLAATIAPYSSSVAAIAAAGVFVLFCALWSAIGAYGNRSILVGSVLVPAFGVMTGIAIKANSNASAGGFDLLGQLKTFALPVAVGAFVIFMFFGKRDTSKQMFLGLFKAAMFFLITATLAKWILPAKLEPLYWAILGCSMPVWWERKEGKMRDAKLAYQARIGSGDTKKLGNNDPFKRLAQAFAAEKDKSGFIQLGVATGKLTSYGDGFAPDKGMPTGFTCYDMRTHVHGFGATGGGKTFNLFMQLIYDWTYYHAGGALVLDGKGSAGEDLLAAFIKRYGLGHNALLIKPGVKLGLMEGLSPNDFIDAISDIGGAKKQEQSQDNSAFFITQARTLGLSIAHILWALVEEDKKSDKRKFFWTIDGIDRVKTFLKKPNEGENTAAGAGTEHEGGHKPQRFSNKDLLEHIKTVASYKVNPLLQDAVRYIEHDFWTQPGDQAGGIVATFDNWIKDLLAHPELRIWGSTETGVDTTIPTRGGFVAVSLPEVKFGMAGKLAQSLIKQRLFVKIRRRGDYNWRAAGETPVLFATDESQELISQADRDFLPQSRGLGGYAAYFTQSYDELESRMGDASTRAFLGNFRSLVSFQATAKTYEYISERAGQGRYVSWNSNSQAIGWISTAQMVANHPLHDEDHPGAYNMRMMRRRGAGKVLIPAGNKMAAASPHGPGTAATIMNRSYHDPSEALGDVAEALTFTASVSSEIKVRPLVLMEDCAEQLNSDQDAIALFRRAGSVRADFIHFDYLEPEQIAARERKFHRSLIFNSLVGTIQRDIVDALGERPKPSVLKRLTYAYIMNAIGDSAFVDRMTAMGALDDQSKKALLAALEGNRKVLEDAGEGAAEIYATLREDLIDLWEQETAPQAQAA